ncbi:hypothetical protein NBRC116584_04770 [Hydrogenophaga sp. 5NK40-0174]
MLSAGSGATEEGPTGSESGATAAGVDVEGVRQRLMEDGSLRGASLDGGWGHWDGQQLHPSLALRQRFDQLLTTQGEATLEELRALVQHLAATDLGEAGAQTVLTQWDAYVKLLASVGETRVDLQNPQSWLAELQRLQRLRAAALGPQWARAFYADEEQALVDRVQAMTTNAAPSSPAEPSPRQLLDADPSADAADRFRQREAALGTAAAQRLEALDQEEAAWQVRLQAARAALGELAQAAELSDAQRQQAIEQYMAQQFKPEEQMRAKALLGL